MTVDEKIKSAYFENSDDATKLARTTGLFLVKIVESAMEEDGCIDRERAFTHLNGLARDSRNETFGLPIWILTPYSR